MTAIVDEVTSFLSESDFWTENLKYQERPDVIYHEINIETNLHPLGLEFLFVEYLKARDLHIKNIGHAAFGDTAYLKPYTAERPIVNFVWKYNPDVVIGPNPERWFSTWYEEGERDYLERVAPRRATSADLEVIGRYFATDHWQQVLAKLGDPEMEHFHVFLHTELHPYDLAGPLRDAIEKGGFAINVPTFYLVQADDHFLADGRQAIMIGLIPDGTTSVEISCIHTPGVIIAPKELSDKERLYGGEGWTVTQYKDFIRKDPYEILTFNEAREIVKRVTRVPLTVT